MGRCSKESMPMKSDWDLLCKHQDVCQTKIDKDLNHRHHFDLSRRNTWILTPVHAPQSSWESAGKWDDDYSSWHFYSTVDRESWYLKAISFQAMIKGAILYHWNNIKCNIVQPLSQPRTINLFVATYPNVPSSRQIFRPPHFEVPWLPRDPQSKPNYCQTGLPPVGEHTNHL